MDLLADYRRRRDERRIEVLEARMACMERALRQCYFAIANYERALNVLRDSINEQADIDVTAMWVH